ncbi:ABC transporter ATP-binding protein [bacterium]|nr:ABC transporter ATP-binding protein [candidate division CSSED10-310 bacterium]
MMSVTVIEVKGLSRRFNRVAALDGLDFQVPAGSVTGFLGPNGAGKSTTIHILMGLLRPHAGIVRVLGMDPIDDETAVRSRIGFVPEDPRGEPRFTVASQLAFLKAFRPSWDDGLTGELLDRLELDPAKPTRTLSRGQRAKLALVGALAFRPELLILDDPTSGLDPLARREFMEGIIGMLAEEGRTVFFSSHQVDDIERVADRVVLLHSGRCVYSASMDELHAKWRLARLRFQGDAPAVVQLPGLRRWECDGREGRAVFDDAGEAGEAGEAALRRMQVEWEWLPFTLEDIYVELVRHPEVRP